MIRPYVYGGIALALISVGIWLYLKGGSDARQDTRRAVEHSQTLERIGNATNDSRSTDDIDDRLRKLAE